MLLEAVGAGLMPAQMRATTRVRSYLTGFYCTLQIQLLRVEVRRTYLTAFLLLQRADVSNNVQNVAIIKSRVAALGGHIHTGCILGITGGATHFDEGH